MSAYMCQLAVLFFFLMILRPPRSTLFPYTTLFRQIDHTSEAFLQVPCVFKEDLVLRQIGTNVDSFMFVDPTHHASDSWNHRIALEHHLRHRRGHSIKLESVGISIIPGDRCACPRNHLRDLGGKRFPEAVHITLRIEHDRNSQEGSIVCFKPVHTYKRSSNQYPKPQSWVT